MTDDELLRLSFRDLPLSRTRGRVADHMRRLHRELRGRGLRFLPHFWYAEEWFSPDGVPGIALPFYLSHPRLMRLERSLMHQVEGGSSQWLMRILRHEAGHALDTAHGLRRRADFRRVFGSAAEKYPEDYRPRPASRRYVLHLDHWYAQSHPTEDFAETFAVWLSPRARWRREYAGWPALRKLEYVDELMREIAARAPCVRTRREVEPVARSRRTLAEHYRGKASRYVLEDGRYDRALCRIFSRRPTRRRDAAASYLRSIRPELERQLVRRAHLHHYVVEHALDVLLHRCSHMHLHLKTDRRGARREFSALAQRVVRGILKRNRENYAL
ncbi:MAG: putative zinc-binding metallopeptidase [Gammaproteobacteria bacterium]|jgi:Putative zinc-binding metallo-peptidase|nr:putative zinc-binding metallopeptidase [Gammaproteobacteria bacterium]